MFKGEDFLKQEKQKTKEALLEDFEDSLEKHGIEGVEVRIEGNILKIRQKSGEGIRGLGYDKKIWMRLNQEKTNSNVANKFRHNENTKASLESDFSGVTFEEVGEGKIKVQIDSDHPAIALAKFLGNKEVQLRGGYSGWGDENPFEYNEESEKWECELEWEEEEECKIMIRDVEFKDGKKVTKPIEVKWDKEYEKGADQVMEIDLKNE